MLRECSLCSAGETEAAEQARIGGKGAFGVTYNITLAIWWATKEDVKKKSGILQSAGMVEKELQNDLSTLVRSVKIKSKHLKKWIPRWNEKKPLSVSITSGRRIDCGGWKLQLSKSDWDKSQRLKVFGRLYFDIQFIYLFEWWWCGWDFCDPLVYDSLGFHCGHWDLWMIFIATATGPMQILILVNILQVECQNKERTLQ